MAALSFSLLTPEGSAAEHKAEWVSAPTVLGEVTILPDHRALLATLVAGPVRVSTEGRVLGFTIDGGFIEVDSNAVSVLAGKVEHS